MPAAQSAPGIVALAPQRPAEHRVQFVAPANASVSVVLPARQPRQAVALPPSAPYPPAGAVVRAGGISRRADDRRH